MARSRITPGVVYRYMTGDDADTRRPKSAGVLLAAYRAAKAGQAVGTGLWDDALWQPAKFLAWFNKCLAMKINARDPRFPSGRKTAPDYELAMLRLRPYVGTRLVIDPDRLHGLDKRIQRALQHRVRTPGDF